MHVMLEKTWQNNTKPNSSYLYKLVDMAVFHGLTIRDLSSNPTTQTWIRVASLAFLSAPSHPSPIVLPSRGYLTSPAIFDDPSCHQLDSCGTLTAVFFSMILSYLVDFQSTNRISQLDINWTRSSAGDQDIKTTFHCLVSLQDQGLQRSIVLQRCAQFTDAFFCWATNSLRL